MLNNNVYFVEQVNNSVCKYVIILKHQNIILKMICYFVIPLSPFSDTQLSEVFSEK